MIGQTLLHYRITDRLGAGGMGEVYRARDEKLDRDVAVKVLPAGALSDEAARRRFRKEANVLSRISHPHIATIHDFDSADGIDFLVMELVPGPSIGEALREGALPEKNVVRLGGQMARGLQAAHEQGVIHRDLKPSNLRLTEDGMLKILDFGVARLEQNARRAAGDATATETADGQVVGTLPYMSPEQLRGRGVDARTDLYSAGVVLYEMATGKRLFSKPSTAELTDAILNQEPTPPREVNGRVSPGLEAVILKTLDKDPELRYQTAKDLRVDLERLQQRSGTAQAAKAIEGPTDARPGRTRERIAWAALALALGGLAAFYALRDVSRNPEARPVVRFSLEMPHVLPALRTDVQLSPDGGDLALTAWLPVVESLWIRSLGTEGIRSLAGTEGASGSFWSPDGASLAFFVPGQDELALRRIDLATGHVRTICTLPIGPWMGGTWNVEGRIVFSASDEQGRARIHTVSAEGGVPRVLLALDAEGEERNHLWPLFLPDGRRFLFTVDSPNDQVRGTWLSSVEWPQERTLLLPGVRFARYASPGYLLYTRGNELLARPFDASRARITGEPAPVDPGIATAMAWSVGDLGLFSTSASGDLAYASEGDKLLELTWFDREGTLLATLGRTAQYLQIQLSPDERRVAAEISDPQGESPDIWTIDHARGVATPVTSAPGDNQDPVWSRDGRELYFSSDREGDGVFRLYRSRLDGNKPEALVPESPLSAWSESVSPGGTLLYVTGGGGRNDSVWALPLTGHGTLERLMGVDYAIDEPQVSPDGRWLAYGADETGAWEVYLVPFREPGEKVVVSTEGGVQPRWRGDGRELFYVTPQGDLMAVPVNGAESHLEVGLPRPLFHAGVTSPIRDEYAVTRDGQRFLVITPVEDSGWSINIVLNWPSLLPATEQGHVR